jgi:hypothetical protein
MVLLRNRHMVLLPICPTVTAINKLIKLDPTEDFSNGFGTPSLIDHQLHCERLDSAMTIYVVRQLF